MEKVVILCLASGFLAAASAQSLSESAVLNNYDGVIGTAPKGKTISAAGAAFEDTLNGANVYGFFTQTLANDIYYEVRAYGRYNYMATNPIFPTIPASNANNPMGYGFSGFLGYNFHPSELLDITPYIRFNYLRNMTAVLENTDGEYIHSSTYTGMLGAKFSFKVIKNFTPYFNFSAGAQQNYLTGQFQGWSIGNAQDASVMQYLSIAELGLNFKVTQSVSLIPYWQYITVSNNPDSVAQASLAKNGFGISNLTGTQQALGFKFSSAW